MIKPWKPIIWAVLPPSLMVFNGHHCHYHSTTTEGQPRRPIKVCFLFIFSRLLLVNMIIISIDMMFFHQDLGDDREGKKSERGKGKKGWISISDFLGGGCWKGIFIAFHPDQGRNSWVARKARRRWSLRRSERSFGWALFSCPPTALWVTMSLTDSLTHSLPLLKNTTTEHSEILVNLVICYQSCGETLPNQQKDEDKDKDKDKEI